MLKVLILLFPILTFAEDKPFELFDTKANEVNNVVVNWITTNNVQKECQQQAKSRGNPQFTIRVEACSFWETTLGMRVCTIVTEKRTNLDTLGHEMRHCFQGNWHK